MGVSVFYFCFSLTYLSYYIIIIFDNIIIFKNI